MFRQVSSSRSFARLSLAAILIMSILALTVQHRVGTKGAAGSVEHFIGASHAQCLCQSHARCDVVGDELALSPTRGFGGADAAPGRSAHQSQQ